MHSIVCLCVVLSGQQLPFTYAFLQHMWVTDT